MFGKYECTELGGTACGRFWRSGSRSRRFSASLCSPCGDAAPERPLVPARPVNAPLGITASAPFPAPTDHSTRRLATVAAAGGTDDATPPLIPRRCHLGILLQGQPQLDGRPGSANTRPRQNYPRVDRTWRVLVQCGTDRNHPANPGRPRQVVR